MTLFNSVISSVRYNKKMVQHVILCYAFTGRANACHKEREKIVTDTWKKVTKANYNFRNEENLLWKMSLEQ